MTLLVNNDIIGSSGCYLRIALTPLGVQFTTVCFCHCTAVGRDDGVGLDPLSVGARTRSRRSSNTVDVGGRREHHCGPLQFHRVYIRMRIKVEYK